MKLIRMGQGPATKVDKNSIAKEKDDFGITQPNLHRRIDPKDPPEASLETSKRSYKLTVSGSDSYRTTQINYHDEESITDETP